MASGGKRRLLFRFVIVSTGATAVGGLFITSSPKTRQTIRNLWSSSNSAENAGLDPSTFTKFHLVAKSPVSSTCSIFTLRPSYGNLAPAAKVSQMWRGQSTLWTVLAKQPLLQIGREYTPLPPLNGLSPEDGVGGGEDVNILVKRENGGEMSGYLHSLPVNAIVELRGPNLDLQIPSQIKEIIFIAGGTGIAPALQVAYFISKFPDSKMSVFWANRRREDCFGAPTATPTARSSWLSSFRSIFWSQRAESTSPTTTSSQGPVVSALEHLKKANLPGSFKVQYFVDEEKSFIKKNDIVIAMQNLTNLDRPGSKLILVSGPDGFVNYWAGSKVWKSGREVQGPLRGVLSTVPLQGWNVWKL